MAGGEGAPVAADEGAEGCFHTLHLVKQRVVWRGLAALAWMPHSVLSGAC